MSMKLDAELRETGTRFRIFPQPRFLSAFSAPETVTISIPPDRIQPGPSDDRMYVIDALNKLPYSKLNRPPYRDAHGELVKPNEHGHFDHLEVGTREFLCATMYATVRRVLDIWEDYFEEPIAWHFESDFERLELIPLIEWDNAQSGYGFLEFGYGRNSNGGIDHSRPYCENFDVLAHELGHSIIFSKIGVPVNPADTAVDYRGMHESAGDLVAIIASLHFDSVVNHILNSTRGNLFTVNELDRLGELSDSREVRVAFNNLRMSDVGKNPHDRSVPLTGGFFDIMVEVFQKKLVNYGLINQDLADRSTQGTNRGQDLEQIQKDFNAAYKGNEAGFKIALLEARDYLGRLLALTWSKLDPNFLTYHDILRELFRADRELTGGEHHRTIRECFAWREISLVPNSFLLQPHTLDNCGLKSANKESKSIKSAINNLVKALHSGSGVNSEQKVADIINRLAKELEATSKKS